MEKKLLLVLLLGAIVVTSAAWVYKENEMQDNQVLVYLTGMDISGEVQLVEETFPEIDSSKLITIRADGGTVDCQLTQFATDSGAIGSTTAGSLQKASKVPTDSPYIELKRTNTQGWGTTETINSLELAGCAVKAVTGQRLVKITEMSAQNGGRLQYSSTPPKYHKAHQNGLSVDLSLICKPDGKTYQVSGCGANPATFDAEASWVIVRTLAARTPVKRILLSSVLINKLKTYANTFETDTVLRQKIFASLFTAREDHNNHMHIDFHCSLKDPQCQDSKTGYNTGIAEVNPAELDTGDEESDAGTASNGAVKSDAELLQIAANRADKCLYFTNDELNPIIRACSQRYGINENLIKAVLYHESTGNACNHDGGQPRAKSSANAKGLMQMRPDGIADDNRFRETSYQIVGDAIYNPSINICAGAQLLAIYWTQYKTGLKLSTTADLLQAYNVGYGNYENGDRNPTYIRLVTNAYTRINSETSLPATPEKPGATVNHLGTTALVS